MNMINELRYRKASGYDADGIVSVYRRFALKLEKDGVNLPDTKYSDINDILTAIKNKEMYLGEVRGDVAVFFSISAKGTEKFMHCTWQGDDSRCAYLGIICVNPKFMGRGVGEYTLSYVEKLALQFKKNSLRTGVYKHMPATLQMYEKLGYKTADAEKDDDISFMEKLL